MTCDPRTTCQSNISGNSFFEVANIQLFLSKYSALFFSLDHSPKCVLFYIGRKRWNERRSYNRKTTWKNRNEKKNKSRLKLQEETEELRTDAKSQKPKTKTVQLAYCCVHIKFKEINEYLCKVRLQIEHVKALEWCSPLEYFKSYGCCLTGWVTL